MSLSVADLLRDRRYEAAIARMQDLCRIADPTEPVDVDAVRAEYEARRRPPSVRGRTRAVPFRRHLHEERAVSGRKRTTLYARFYSHVALPDQNGCMLWTGYLRGKGYGEFRVGRTMMPAHRVALWLAEGAPTSAGMVAAHAPVVCHRPHCVAPAHLRWATLTENQLDRVPDGTHQRGDRHPLARLTTSDVIRIRSMRSEGMTHRAIASVFQVAEGTVGDIIRGKRWAHVPGGGA